ncbi:hypothetical protein ACHAXR_008411, partial [Thalassiosira sp. AJA248-18]
NDESMNRNSPTEPERKRSTVRYDKRKGKSYSTCQSKPYAPLQELGFPSSLSMLVQNLIDAHDAYSSLDAAKNDIHILVSDPECFLFDLEDLPSKGGSMQLMIKKGKLYGRGKEVSLITDAFCRVSSGKNEAFFIGGYSGSGKTMLVHSLRARIDIAGGGYVLTQKVDQMSKERPMLDILSAFNTLCLLIKNKSATHELLGMATMITTEFESDFSVLARLLPNINVLFPQLVRPTIKDAGMEQMMNLHNICYTLQRFLRIVSSRLKPVMLFLDDLQWAGSTSLGLIQSLLSDTREPSCFFFVGSYRDNEVKQEHPIFDLMTNLELCGVKTEKVHLGGLTKDDLNLMISESLCIFPRLCKSLSDIVFAKTDGNPYFSLEFLRSLVSSGLLKYSLRERRWIWDESKIRSENIEENVLYLLTANMTSLPENTQKALKVCSCFGIKADEWIVGYLSSTSEYSDFRLWLDRTIDEGCIQKVDSQFKFVHDKVREAAYSLISDNDKTQFHYDLGMLLHSASKDQDLGARIFQIVDQINHGIPDLIRPDMQMDIAVLNFKSGSTAIEFSDYDTALSYLNNALLLLPINHWSSNYELCLRLFYLKAKATYSCGDIENAYELLKKIIEKGRCTEDKLDAYYLYVTILHACDESNEAYITCQEVLSQLNETVPGSIDMREVGAAMREVGAALGRMSDRELSKMKEMEMDGVFRYTLKFYTLLICIAFWKNPTLLPWCACRMINLSLKHDGVCQDSVFAFVQYAAVLCQQCNLAPDIEEACRVGKAAMSLLKRFDSPEIVPKVYFCYFGFVAVHTEPLQVCTDNLRKGFEVGMSAGSTGIQGVAFYNSIHLIRTALLGGENLSSLLKESDYHLELMTRFHNKLSMPYVLAYRETIAKLIDKGQSSSNPAGFDENTPSSNAVYLQRHKETIYFNNTLQSFWLGYSHRCHHYAEKALDMHLLGRHNRLMILFYATLNSFRGVRNNNGNGSQFVKVRTMYKVAISALRSAAELSPWNFSNKVFLLQAELYSFEGKSQEAKSSYAAAVNSSCSAKFVHEQGLACELAGFHYKKTGQAQIALDFFQQAKECYIRWGSQMKVESITQQMEKVRSSYLSNTAKSSCFNLLSENL